MHYCKANNFQHKYLTFTEAKKLTERCSKVSSNFWSLPSTEFQSKIFTGRRTALRETTKFGTNLFKLVYCSDVTSELEICLFAHRSFAHLLILLRSNERLWAIRSDRSRQMSNRERIPQVAQDK